MSDVTFMLDEAALLGHLDAIDNAVGIGRGYGIRLTFIYQSLGQLQKCFPDGQDTTVLANVTSVWFAVNDNATADYVSARLGDETITVASGGTSYGTSWQSTGGAHPSESHGGSTTTNHNWSLTSRRLLQASEVMNLPPRMAITFTPNVPPIATWLLRHFEEKNLLAKANGPRPRSKTAWVQALFVFLVMSAIALVLTHEFVRPPERSMPPAAINDGTQSRVASPGGDDVQDERSTQPFGSN